MNPERLYLKLFSIPPLKILILLSIAFSIVFTSINKIYLIYFAVFLISLAIAVHVLKLRFDAKRILFFALMLSTISVVLAFFRVYACIEFLYALVLYFCSESGLLYVLLYTAVVFLTVDFFAAVQLPIACISLILFLMLLDRKTGVLSIRDFLRAFVLLWLTSNPEYLERYLLNVSEKFTGRVRCLRIGCVKLISTDFHPGPFRNVGGAKMIEELTKAKNTIYLHSPTTHSRNPVSHSDLKKIVSAVRCNGIFVKPMKPFEISGERFEVICFPFDRVKLVFVSGKERIDDFLLECEDFVVDCHNAYKREFYMDDSDVNEIKELLEGVKDLKTNECELRCGFVKKHVETDSICGYIAALLLDFSGERYALISIDSNNVLINFRKYIEENFYKLGFKAIVTSTDNHSKTGIRAKIAYKPAGSDERDWIAMKDLIDSCKRIELNNCECYYSENTVTVNVMGEKFMIASSDALSRYNFYLSIFLLFIVLNIIASFLINYIIL